MSKKYPLPLAKTSLLILKIKDLLQVKDLKNLRLMFLQKQIR